MNVELLELLELDDLQGEARELAECIGMEAFRRLLERYGGTGKMYIPQPDKVVIPVRDVLIRREYNGYNTYELARKWKLSDAYVRQIVKDKAAEIRRAPPDGQLTFDDCALPGFVDSKNEEKTERNAGYLVVSHSGGGMLRQGTRKGIRRTPANRGMRAHRIVKSLDISEDVCHGLCP